MNQQENPLEALEQTVNQQQQEQQSNSTLSSINPDPVDLTELVVGLGKDALEFVSSIADHIDF